MSRVLPITAVQAQPLRQDQPLSRFCEQVRALVASFPQTRLIVYPELHLFDANTPLQKDALLAISEPLDGTRLKTLSELAGDLGVWLVPGSVC